MIGWQLASQLEGRGGRTDRDRKGGREVRLGPSAVPSECSDGLNWGFCTWRGPQPRKIKEKRQEQQALLLHGVPYGRFQLID